MTIVRAPDIVGEITIERPVTEVFDFVADEHNEPLYNPLLTHVEQLTEGAIGPGTRFRAQTSRGRRSVPMTIELTEYERPRGLASSTHLSVMDIRGRLTFEPVRRGTRMRWRWTIEPRGPLRLARPLVARLGARQERAIWSSLKRYLEATE